VGTYALYRGNVGAQAADSSGNLRTLTVVGTPGNSTTSPPEGDAWLCSLSSTSDYFKIPLAAIPPSGVSGFGSICFYWNPGNNGTNQQSFHIAGAGYFSCHNALGGTSLVVEYTKVGGGSGSVTQGGMTLGVTYAVRVAWTSGNVALTIEGIGTTNSAFGLDFGTPSDTARNTIGVNSYSGIIWPMTNCKLDLFQLSDDPAAVFPPVSGVTGSLLSPTFMRRRRRQ